MDISKYRDLTLTQMDRLTLVTACDSCGAVGEKKNDALKCPPYITGRYTCRGVLMELMTFGASVISVTDTVCCEMQPTGAEIIRGIKDEMTAAGLDTVMLNGSTEENMPASMTAVGITAVGIAARMPSGVAAGDHGVLIGKMKMGTEVVQGDDSEIISYRDVREMLGMPGVKEIVPIGSKGLGYEAALLAGLNGRRFVLTDGFPGDAECSGGPSTAALAVTDEDTLPELLKNPKAIYAGKFI